MSEPTTEELRATIDFVVGDPSPARDLAAAARRRGTAMRHQRVAGSVTVALAVGIIAVPATFLLHGSSSPAGVAVGGQPAASAGPVASASPSGAASASASASASTSGPSPSPSIPVHVEFVAAPALTAPDHSRIAAALSLLGPGYHVVGKSISLVDPHTGKNAGTMVSYEIGQHHASVGISWVEILPGDHDAARHGAAGAKAVQLDRGIGATWEFANSTMQLDVRVVQAQDGGGPEILPGKHAQTFVDELMAATS